MPFTVKKRGKLTYYFKGERPVLSSLVTEELPDGDLKISFAGLTGGYSAKNVLGRDELVTMDPAREIPLVFECWELWLQEAGICESLRDVDFIEIHAFGCQPKSPNPVVDPTGFAREQERLRKAYAEAYAGISRPTCPTTASRPASRSTSSTFPTRRPPTSSTEPRCCSVAARARERSQEVIRGCGGDNRPLPRLTGWPPVLSGAARAAGVDRALAPTVASSMGSVCPLAAAPPAAPPHRSGPRPPSPAVRVPPPRVHPARRRALRRRRSRRGANRRPD